MKTFEIKCVNMRAYRSVALVLGLGGLAVTSTTFVRLMARYGEIGAVAPVLVTLMVILLVKAFFKRERRVGVSDTEIVLFKKGGEMPLARLRLDQIALIRHTVRVADDHLSLYRRGGAAPAIKLSTFGESERVRALIDEIGRHTALVRSTIAEGRDEYLSADAVQSAPQAVRRIQKRHNPKRAVALVVVAALLVFFVAPFLLLLINKSGGGYQIGSDRVTWDGEPLALNVDQLEQLGLSIVKDSTRVYYNGTLLEWADAPSFEEIGPLFFRDRGGIYQDKQRLLAADKLVPLEGDFDAATLTAVDNVFYKDRDRLWYFNFELISTGSPLRPVELEGIDPATFEALDHIWYRDARSVYFGGWADLRRAEEVDRDTFEPLTWQVAKDRNNVYYLTRFLTTSENKQSQSTGRNDYAVLEGAHAPSFRMIDSRTFEDKFTVWTIGDPASGDAPTRQGK